jgi:hypothetical protein
MRGLEGDRVWGKWNGIVREIERDGVDCLKVRGFESR